MSNRPKPILSAYDIAILSRCWTLDEEDKQLLDAYKNYSTTLETFFKRLWRAESGNHKYDSLRLEQHTYCINYIGTSARLLREELYRDKHQTVYIQVRRQSKSKFFAALVLLNNKAWTGQTLPSCTKIVPGS